MKKIYFTLALLGMCLLLLIYREMRTINNTPVILKVLGQGYPDIVLEWYVFLGADVNRSDENGYTPLMLAASFCSKEHVKFLLSHGADPNLMAKGNYTALIGIGYNGSQDSVEIAKLLVNHGADFSMVSDKGDTALSNAVKLGDQKLKKYFESLIVPPERSKTLESEL